MDENKAKEEKSGSENPGEGVQSQVPEAVKQAKGEILYFLDDETWILFDNLLRFVPIKTYNKEAYLQNHLKIELKEDPYIYFVNFSDFKIKEGISPLSFEKENIRQIIINKRKLNIIRHMREEVFQTALENNDFEIY